MTFFDLHTEKSSSYFLIPLSTRNNFIPCHSDLKMERCSHFLTEVDSCSVLELIYAQVLKSS